jgi:hypothetical protein
VIGPYESIATMMPAILNIAIAASATPNTPHKPKETRMPTMIVITGQAVASIEIARPAMMLVACPVSDALAMC